MPCAAAVVRVESVGALDAPAARRLQVIEREADERFSAVAELSPGVSGTLTEGELEAAANSGLLWVAKAGGVHEAGGAKPAGAAHGPAGLAAGQGGEETWVGFACAQVLPAEAHGAVSPLLVLEQVSVQRSFGGQGIGTALVGAVIAQAVRRGLSAVWLRTFRSVSWNAPWYRKLGFIEQPDDLAPVAIARRVEAERLAGLQTTQRVTMRLVVTQWQR